VVLATPVVLLAVLTVPVVVVPSVPVVVTVPSLLVVRVLPSELVTVALLPSAFDVTVPSLPVVAPEAPPAPVPVVAELDGFDGEAGSSSPLQAKPSQATKMIPDTRSFMENPFPRMALSITRRPCRTCVFAAQVANSFQAGRFPKARNAVAPSPQGGR
jgi:hypothetical protein